MTKTGQFLLCDARTLSYRSQCAWCKHFNGRSGINRFTCAAFPIAIPNSILLGEEKHIGKIDGVEFELDAGVELTTGLKRLLNI